MSAVCAVQRVHARRAAMAYLFFDPKKAIEDDCPVTTLYVEQTVCSSIYCKSSTD